jgi:tRNA pseudouridine32 synthase/23S rRNA pseudouridine746 synthase
MTAGDDRSGAPSFESEHELVLLKPPGISCELPGDADRHSWRARLEAERGERLWLCHRLDRIARGLVLIARNAQSAAFHAEAMRRRRITKVYLVRVDGVLATRHLGTHRAYLRRRGRRAELVRSGGDPARLDVLATAPAPDRAGQGHVVLRLGTGRFHQIRVMLAALGHPLAGDEAYGGSPPTDSDTPWLESAVLGFEPFGPSVRHARTLVRVRSGSDGTRSGPDLDPGIEATLANISEGSFETAATDAEDQREASGGSGEPASTQ